jgi:prophage regulatory protein
MRLLSYSEVQTRTSLSRATIDRRIKAGTFPKSIPVDGVRRAFIDTEIDAWIEALIRRARSDHG